MEFLDRIQNKRSKNALLHFTAWVGYGFFLYIANLLTKPDTTITQVLFYLVPFCITFYVSIYCLGLYKEKGIIWNISSFFVVFIVMSLIGYIYIFGVLPFMGVVVYSTKSFKPFLQEAVLGYIKFFAFALLFFHIRESFKKDKRLRLLHEEKLYLEKLKNQKELENAELKQQELKAQQERLQFEYAFLRSQVNPHFLLNTLNMLFSEAMDYSPELAENILKLSSIMRYSLESLEFESGKVLVQKELEHLQNLIDINNLRFGKSKNIIYEVEGNLDGQMIPPLAFITIVENAFKYGDLKDPLNPLVIKVFLEDKKVSFYCRNKKRANTLQLSSFNIGITNLGKRLDVAFKDKYEVKVTNEETFYIFELTVNS